MKLQEFNNKVKRNISKLLQGFRADLTTISGLEKHSHQPMRTLYIGNYHQFNFLVSVLYSDFEVIDSRKRVPIQKWLPSIKNPPQVIDLVACEFPSLLYFLFNKNDYLFFPKWVNQSVNINKPWDEVFQGFRKNMRRDVMRIIRQYNLRYEFSNNDSDFEIFFHEMLLPNMEIRFGDLAMETNKKAVRNSFNTGELVKLYMSEELIGMTLTIHDKKAKKYYFKKIGSPYTGDKTIYRAVNMGLYYFMIKDAHNKGCSSISLGHSRALLNDGLFQYKRKWGAEISAPRFFQTKFLLNPKHLNGAVRSLFSNNIFLVSEDNAYSTKFLVSRESADVDSITFPFERYDITGLNRFKVFSCEGFNGNIAEIKGNLPDKIELFDLSNSSDPAGDFRRL